MAGTHRLLNQMYEVAFATYSKTASEVLTCTKDRQVFEVTTAGAEARTLARPTKEGLECKVVLDVRVGDLTLTVTGGYNQAADTAIVFGTAGDWVKFHSVKVGTSYYWRVLSQEGTNATPTTEASGSYTALTVGTLTLGATALTVTGAQLNAAAVTTAGTLEASKALVVDSAKHINELKTTALHLGASGAATQVTATASQLNALAGASAGIAAVLAGGLGGSASFAKTSAATTTLVAANATKDRAVLVVVVVDETYAIGTGTLPTVKIGEDDTIEKCMAATVLDTEAAGTVYVFAFTNTATKKIVVTTTAAVGNSTGGCTVTAIAIPTT